MSLRTTLPSILALGLAVVVAACGGEPDDDAMSAESASTADGAAWSATWWPDRQTWYRVGQGSHLVEYDLFLALERSGSTALFVEPEHMAKLGFVYPPADAKNMTDDARLPLGVVRDDKGDVPYVGFTCAACHTGTVQVKGKPKIIVEGGQSFIVLDRFLRELADALEDTTTDAAKRSRLCQRIGAARCAERLEAARDEVAGIIQRSPSDVVEGPGRIDAIGREFNEVYARQLGDEAPYAVKVPVSIPQVWDAPRMSCVQTNCVSQTALTRNLSEVFGVFGHTTLRRSGKRPEITSSAKLENLHALELSLKTLPSPRWDEAVFGSIDRAAASRGEAIFARECSSCHKEPYKAAPPAGAIEIENGPRGPVEIWKATTTDYRDVGTDPAFMDVHLNRTVKAPVFRELLDDWLWGKAAAAVGASPDSVLAAPIIWPAYSIAQAYMRSKGAYRSDGSVSALFVYGAIGDSVATTQIRAMTKNASDAKAKRQEYDLYRKPSGYGVDLEGYRARPLNGIAFTAPFGHAGAWPTLRDVLTPPAQRPASFVVRPGSFDTAAVGLDVAPSRAGEDLFVFDTSVAGNGRQGHAYGTALPAAQKDDLLEYLKSL